MIQLNFLNNIFSYVNKLFVIKMLEHKRNIIKFRIILDKYNNSFLFIFYDFEFSSRLYIFLAKFQCFFICFDCMISFISLKSSVTRFFQETNQI